MTGQISYFEVPTEDTAAARRFWGGLLGWTFCVPAGTFVRRTDDQGVAFTLWQDA